MEMHNRQQGVFDRFIDQFSTSELKSRVWFVVAFGLCLTAVAAALGWMLFTHPFFVADAPGLESITFGDLIMGHRTP